jgi:hypothetical protein
MKIVILDASLTDATEVVLLRLCVRLESWQCPIPTASRYNGEQVAWQPPQRAGSLYLYFELHFRLGRVQCHSSSTELSEFLNQACPIYTRTLNKLCECYTS